MKGTFGMKTLLAFAGFIALASCTVSRKTVYFNDLPDSTRFVLGTSQFTEPVIRPDDILNIDIQTVDPTSASALNQGTSIQLIGASSVQSTGNQQTTGFLVDKMGNVAIPMFGEIPVGGLTTFEAKELIAKRVSALYKDPTIQVRFANYKVTVLGEVAKPGTYTVPNEKVTLFDAIGLAGDLTIHGKRNNVLLIRETDGHKEFIRFDLNSALVFESPYFYLKQNDLIYVEPGKGKAASADAPRLQFASVIASFLSIAVVLLTRL